MHTLLSQLNRLSYYLYQELQRLILYLISLENFDSKQGFCLDFQLLLFLTIRSPKVISHRDPFCLGLIILFNIYMQPYFSSISLSNSALTTCITKSDSSLGAVSTPNLTFKNNFPCFCPLLSKISTVKSLIS